MTHADEDLAVELAVELARRFPPLGDDIDFYYDGPDEFLAHVYFGVAVTPRVVAAYLADPEGTAHGELDWRGVLDVLDARARNGGEAVATIIGTSFLFRLPLDGQAGYGIVDELPGELARLFRLARPRG